MARPVKFPPKIYFHRQSGQARVRVGKKLIDLGPYGSERAQKEYLRVVTELSEGRQHKPALPQSALRVSTLAAQYLDGVAESLDPRELWHVRRSLKTLVAVHGHTRLADFGPVHLEEVRERFISEKLNGRTINRYLTRIRKVWRWAARRELVPAEWPARLSLLEPLRRGDKRVHWPEPIRDVPAEVVEATLPYLLPTVRAMVKLQQLTGARPGELVRICPVEIDQQGIIIGDVRIMVWTPRKHKRQAVKGRKIPLGPQAQKVLVPYLQRDPEAYCFSPREAVGKNWPEAAKKKPGDAYSVSSYQKSIAQAIRRANRERAREGKPAIPHWHPHRLRHSAATAAHGEVGLGLDAARALLGHDHADITLLYAHANFLLAAKAAAALG